MLDFLDIDAQTLLLAQEGPGGQDIPLAPDAEQATEATGASARLFTDATRGIMQKSPQPPLQRGAPIIPWLSGHAAPLKRAQHNTPELSPPFVKGD